MASARGIEAGWIKRKDSSRRTNQQLGLLLGGREGDKWEGLKQHWRQRPIMQSVKTKSQGKKKKMKSKKKKDRPDAKPLVVAI